MMVILVLEGRRCVVDVALWVYAPTKGGSNTPADESNAMM